MNDPLSADAMPIYRHHVESLRLFAEQMRLLDAPETAKLAELIRLDFADLLDAIEAEALPSFRVVGSMQVPDNGD